MLARDHDVPWSYTALRHVLESLHTGMAPHRHATQVDRVVSWMEQARASKECFRPTLQSDAAASLCPYAVAWDRRVQPLPYLSVLARRGTRVGTVYLGQIPEAGQ